MSEREARLYLSVVAEPGDPQIAAAVQQRGAEDAWRHLVDATASDASSLASVRTRAERAAQILERASSMDARFIIPGDPEWPTQLADLDGPASISEQTGAPLGLWIAGTGNLAELTDAAVTIVGTRACTSYGETAASELAADLSNAGYTVISGGAYGIDAAAHRGAMARRTPTIAVMASGIDTPHPPSHSTMFRRIAERGLVISELPPGEFPTRTRFLARNRVLAALSQGTLLIEAAHRSGARHTVAWADALGRAVMAVPGPVTSSQSHTPHQLISQGVARLVTSAHAVMDNLAVTAPSPAVPPKSAPSWERISNPAPSTPATSPLTAATQGRTIGP